MKITTFLSKFLTLRHAPNALTRLEKKGMRVGTQCSFQEGVVFDESYCWLISIGNQVTLAPYVYVLAHDASMIKTLGYARIGKVTIEDKVFVGARTMIMPGVTIGSESIIGADSLVTKDIPPRVVAAGHPAKVLCDLDTFANRHKQCMNKAPIFTLHHKIHAPLDPKIRADMVIQMQNGIGYIV